MTPEKTAPKTYSAKRRKTSIWGIFTIVNLFGLAQGQPMFPCQFGHVTNSVASVWFENPTPNSQTLHANQTVAHLEVHDEKNYGTLGLSDVVESLPSKHDLTQTGSPQRPTQKQPQQDAPTIFGDLPRGHTSKNQEGRANQHQATPASGKLANSDGEALTPTLIADTSGNVFDEGQDARRDQEVQPLDRVAGCLESRTFRNTSLQPRKVRAKPTQLNPIPTDELVSRELARLRTGLSTPWLSQDVCREMLSQPVAEPGDVPDYFKDGQLNDDLLPAYLRGLRVKLDEINITREQYNRFIYECCVCPEGRDEFFSPDNVPGEARDFEVDVKLTDYTPWQEHLRPCSPADKVEVAKVIDRNLSMDLIEHSRAPYASRCVLVRKSSGRHQLAVCLNTLNSRCVHNSYPLPLIRDNLDCLAAKKFISSIDICGAYLSMVVKESCRDLFSFITHMGLYRWKVVPYGWKNAGSHFNYLMDTLLSGLKWQILTTYADDCLVWGGITFEDHLKVLNTVFSRLQKGGLRVSVAKCAFFQKSIEYLGFIVTLEGVKPAEKNTAKLRNANVKTVKDLRGFLGLANFYRRWIPKYATLVAPLYDLLKNTPTSLKLTEKTTAIITAVKDYLCSEPILKHPDFEKMFYLKQMEALKVD
jgi:hypothetical protein